MYPDDDKLFRNDNFQYEISSPLDRPNIRFACTESYMDCRSISDTSEIKGKSFVRMSWREYKNKFFFILS